MPKWKFKLTSNLAVQIQPKLTRAHVLLFECIAIRTENPSLKLFTEPKSLRGQSYWRMKFELFHDEPGAEWAFKPKSAGRGHGCSSSGLLELRSSVIAALHSNHFATLKPDLMLSPACLCCGKGLTDPVSMARWIGPECWGSASTNIPRIYKAEAPEREQQAMEGFERVHQPFSHVLLTMSVPISDDCYAQTASPWGRRKQSHRRRHENQIA